MSSSRPYAAAVIAMAIGTMLVAVATRTRLAEAASTQEPAAPHRMVDARLGGPLVHALRKLHLTAAQKATVRGILAGVDVPGGQMTVAQFEALNNPGDPSHAAAVQAAEARATERIQQRSYLDGEIYAALTADQQAALPPVLAKVQSRKARRHRHWLL